MSHIEKMELQALLLSNHLWMTLTLRCPLLGHYRDPTGRQVSRPSRDTGTKDRTEGSNLELEDSLSLLVLDHRSRSKRPHFFGQHANEQGFKTPSYNASEAPAYFPRD